MLRRTVVQLMCLGLPVPPVAVVLAADALQASPAIMAVSAFGSFLVYGVMFAWVARCPRCHASIMPRMIYVPTSCQSCNLDLTRPRSR